MKHIQTFFLLLLSWFGFSQSEDALDSLLTDLFEASEINIESLLANQSQHHLYASLSSDEHVYFMGRDFDIDQFSLSPSLSYINASNFFLTVGGNYYSGLTPQWDAFTMSAGTSIKLNRKNNLKLNVGYSRSFFTDNNEALNPNTLSSSLRFRHKTLRLGLAGGWMFGGDETYYLLQNNTLNLSLFNTNSFSLGLRPDLSFMFSKQLISETVNVQVLNRVVTQTLEKENFGLINTQLEIPLDLDVGNWDFELAYTFNFPTPIEGESAIQSSGYWSFSLGYLVGF